MKRSFSETISYSNLPLAIYLEIAAHLEQISGVRVQIVPEDQPKFAYHHSQAKGMIINAAEEISPVQKKLMQSILDYYTSLYGAYR